MPSSTTLTNWHTGTVAPSMHVEAHHLWSRHPPDKVQPYVSSRHTFCTCELIAMLLQFLCSCPLPQIAGNIPVFTICLIISYLNALTKLLFLSSMASLSALFVHTCPRANLVLPQQTNVPTLPVAYSVKILSFAYGFIYFTKYHIFY